MEVARGKPNEKSYLFGLTPFWTMRERARMAEISMEDAEQEDVEMVDAAPEEVDQYLVLGCHGCVAMASLVTGCGHMFCQSCVNTFVHPTRQCPVCEFHVCHKMVFFNLWQQHQKRLSSSMRYMFGERCTTGTCHKMRPFIL